MLQQVADRKAGKIGFQCTGIQFGYVEQGADELFSRFERAVDVVDQNLGFAFHRLAGKC